jgi:hypothetical protein
VSRTKPVEVLNRNPDAIGGDFEHRPRLARTYFHDLQRQAADSTANQQR